MDAREYLEILHVAERLKDTPRHCTTSQGRTESVAEHSWRISLMAFLLRSEFPDLDMDKVTRMCLIHDLGECFTGDIPTFLKTDTDRETEDSLLDRWVRNLPEPLSREMSALYREMDAQQTGEAKLYKALDKLEALIQHNESPLDTWSENEYELNKEEYDKICKRSNAFIQETGLRHAPWITMITTEGVAQGKYAGMIQSQVKLDDLFAI